MKKEKGDISDIIKKGEYVFIKETKSEVVPDFSFYIGRVNGYFSKKIRIKGYKVTATGLLASISKIQFQLHGFYEGVSIFDFLMDNVEYSNIEEIIDIDNKELNILSERNYLFCEEWLKLGLPDLFSQYNNTSKQKKIKKQLESKVKKSKSIVLKKLLVKAIKEL